MEKNLCLGFGKGQVFYINKKSDDGNIPQVFMEKKECTEFWLNLFCKKDFILNCTQKVTKFWLCLTYSFVAIANVLLQQ